MKGGNIRSEIACIGASVAVGVSLGYYVAQNRMMNEHVKTFLRLFNVVKVSWAASATKYIFINRIIEIRRSIMPISIRENYLRTVEMRGSERIPCTVFWPHATWSKHREKLEDVIIKHPSIFGDYRRGDIDFDDFGVRRAGQTYEDEWGCIWYHAYDGLAGQVKVHPLEDWKALDSYEPPNPLELDGPPLADYPPKSHQLHSPADAWLKL